MYARVTIAQGHPHPEKAEEGIRLHRESVMPETRQQPGHTGTLLLVDRVQGKGITIDLYETEAHAKAAEESGHDQKQISKFSHLITAPVVQEVYEVAVHDIEIGSTIGHASVTFAQVQADRDKQEEGIKIFRDSAVPAMRQLKGFKGAMLLRDPATGKAISFGMYETEADMVAAEKDGHYQRQLAKYAHLFTAPPRREVFEVAFHHLA